MWSIADLVKKPSKKRKIMQAHTFSRDPGVLNPPNAPICSGLVTGCGRVNETDANKSTPNGVLGFVGRNL